MPAKGSRLTSRPGKEKTSQRFPAFCSYYSLIPGIRVEKNRILTSQRNFLREGEDKALRPNQSENGHSRGVRYIMVDKLKGRS